MPISHITAENFESITSREGIVMIDCWAEWCAACKEFNPTYEKTAKLHENHLFAKLNTVEQKQLVDSLGIEHIPTLMLYRDGVLLFQQPGYYAEDKLEDIISQAESLNMEEVKAHIAAETNNKS